MPKMSDAELRAFLIEPQHLVRIGSVDGDGQPTVLPFWFLYSNDHIYVTLRVQSTIAHDVLHSPKIGLCIDESAIPDAPFASTAADRAMSGRKVVIRATAKIVHQPGEDAKWRDLYFDLAKRYFAEDVARDYLESTKHIARYLIAVPCRSGDESVKTWRSPGEGEDKRAWWPQKYWQPTVPTGLEDR
jgi:nitroimidazol reductase NimA-like FMN-containing flavoprotein (pyridoxamine 5'-phosphate oxidase superfamily)